MTKFIQHQKKSRWGNTTESSVCVCECVRYTPRMRDMI